MIQTKAQPEGWLFKVMTRMHGEPSQKMALKLNRICRTFATQLHDNNGQVKLSHEKLR
jgi:hypothetical protein